MTQVKITRDADGNIFAVNCIGHAGYADGEDIVCASLSSIVQTALLGLLTVARVNVEFKRDDREGLLDFTLPKRMTKQELHDCQIILQTMRAGIADLEEGFSRYIHLEDI